MQRARQFVGLHDRLTDHLAQLVGTKETVPVSDLITRAAERDSAIREFEPQLRKFDAMMSFLIPDRRFPEHVQMEPTQEVLERFYDVVHTVISPTRLSPTFDKPLRCFSPADPLTEALKAMEEGDFSQVVVRTNGEMEILTHDGISRWLERQARRGIPKVEKATIGDALAFDPPENFAVMSGTQSIFEAQQALEHGLDQRKPRVAAVIVTKTGQKTEKPIGIATPWDLSYMFALKGEAWVGVYAGTDFAIRDGKGPQYLSHLLRTPHRWMTAMQLVFAVEGLHALDSETSRGHRTGNAKIHDDQGSVGPAGPVDSGPDAEAVREYRKQVRELRSDLREADAYNDAPRISRLRYKIRFLEDELKRAGQKRVSPELERARVNVTKQIKGVIRRIRKQSPALARHLDQTVKTGYSCAYRPDPNNPPIWQF